MYRNEIKLDVREFRMKIWEITLNHFFGNVCHGQLIGFYQFINFFFGFIAQFNFTKETTRTDR